MADCIDLVQKAVEDADEQDVKEIVDRLQDLKNRDALNYREKAQALIKESRRNRLTERAHKIAQENVVAGIVEHLDQKSLEGKPLDAVLSLFERRDFIIDGGDNNIGAVANSIRTNLTSDLVTRLDEAGVIEALRKAEIDKDVMINLFRLSDGAQVPAKGTSKQSFQAAKAIHLTQRDMLRQLQGAGSLIQELSNYIMKQSHDGFKLQPATKNPKQAFDDWFNFTIRHLDHERTFGEFANDNAKVREFMQGVFDEIVTGDADRALGVAKSFARNLDERINKHRKLHFKDGAHFFEYNMRFGTENLLESVLKSINITSDNIAVMSRLGPDPEQGFQAAIAHVRKQIKGRPDLEAEFNRESSVNAMQAAFKQATGQLRAGANMRTQMTQAVLALNGARLLGKAPISSITDVMNSALQMRSATGESFLGSMFDLQKNFLSLIGDKDTQKFVAQVMKIQVDATLGETVQRFNLDTNLPGGIAKLNRAYYKLNLLTQQTDIGKLANTMTLGAILGRQAGKSFQELGSVLRETFRGFGIEAKEWDLLRAGDFDVGGLKVLAPETINKQLQAAKGKEAKALRQVLIKWTSVFNEVANRGSPTPGAREKRVIAQGFFFEGARKDSPAGILFQLAGQFKQFPVTQWHLMKRLILTADPELRARTLKEALGSRSTQLALAQSMLGMGVMGYTALALKDLIDGREPRDPTDPKTITESILSSGFGGLYADMILGEHDRIGQTFTSSLLGPTAGLADNAKALLDRTKRGEAKAKEWFDFGWRLVPGNNLFYTKRALDYLLINEIRESLSPGYLRRLERRANDNPGLFSEEQQILVPLTRGQ